MGIREGRKMLETIRRADFEEKAFAAWCAYGDGMSFGKYLELLDERNAPPKTQAEIYAEIDKLFEGR